MEFSRREYWNGLLFHSPGDNIPNPEIDFFFHHSIVSSSRNLDADSEFIIQVMDKYN